MGGEQISAGQDIPIRGKPRTLESTILKEGKRVGRMVGGGEGDGVNLRVSQRYLRDFQVWRERLELHK